jgi:SAM-dependent methyltransferase
MTSSSTGNQGQYALATGEQAVGRLKVLHSIYSPVGREVLLEAGIAPGMKVADFGCGTGTMTHTLASIIGVSGSVTGIDVNAPQLEQARQLCDQEANSCCFTCRIRLRACGRCGTFSGPAAFSLSRTAISLLPPVFPPRHSTRLRISLADLALFAALTIRWPIVCATSCMKHGFRRSH